MRLFSKLCDMSLYQKRNAGKVTKILLAFVMSCLILFGMILRPMAAEDVLYTNDETGFQVKIVDDEDLLSPDEEKKLAEDMKPITAYGHVIFQSSYGSGYSTVRDFARANRPELTSSDSVLFIIDMYYRELYVFAGGKMKHYVTDSVAVDITDNVFSYASKGDYYNCAKEAFAQVLTVSEGGSVAQPLKIATSVLLALILGILFNYYKVCKSRKIEVPAPVVPLGAIAGDVLRGSTAIIVYERIHHSSSSSSGGGGGGFSGGGGGGGGGSFSGGGHSF